MNKGKALVVCGGGLRGAYDVGALRALYDFEKPHEFDAIYAVSVGVFASTFFAANQVETMENTWRQFVHGSQLINFFNPIWGREILDLDYLVEIFQSDVSKLHLDRVMSCSPSITYVLTEQSTGQPAYVNAKSKHIFDYMRASSALPVVYTKEIIIDGVRYVDGGLSDPIPIKKAIDDGYHDITVVLNRPFQIRQPEAKFLTWLLVRGKKIREAITTSYKRWNSIEKMLTSLNQNEEYHLRVIRPEVLLTIKRLSRKRELILKAIEQGKADAKRVLSKNIAS